MLADEVDAVIGADTHRDSHALEMTAASGATMSTLAITNDAWGFADAVCWIAENAPGPRLVAGLEGSRSYGIGLSRAHQTTTGRAVLAVSLPIIVCCGGGFVLAVMGGILGGLAGHH